MFALVALSILSADSPPTPKAVLLDVGLVRIAPHRPGTDKPWDEVTERPAGDKCGLLGLASLGGIVGAGAGVALKGVCESLKPGETKVEKHDPTEPDVYVRVVAAPGVSVRSYTVANTLSHLFHHRVVVPIDAIPPAGIEIDVQDDDGKGEEESQENLGVVHLRKAALLEKLAGDGLIKLDDKGGGLETIEITVAPADEPRHITSRLDVAARVTRVERFEVSGGEILEVVPKGTYRVANRLTNAFGQAGVRAGNLNGPFAAAPHGAPIVVTGRNGWLNGAPASGCLRQFVSAPGLVLLGINDAQGGADSGDLDFDLSVRPPTASEWKSGQPEGACTPVEEPFAAANVPPPSSSAPPPEPPVAGAPPPAPPLESDATGKWVAAADRAVKTLFEKQGPAIASTVIKLTHPTGGGANLLGGKLSREGEVVALRFQVAWSGTFGAHHTTTFFWEFNERRHIRAVIESDTADFKADEQHKRALNEYFESKFYPAVMAEIQRG